MMRTFCGVLMLALALPTAGCGDDKMDDGGSTGTNPGTESQPTGTTADVPTGGTDATTGGDGGMCSPQAQDCPAGSKCTAYAAMDTMMFWDTNKCVPEPENGGLQGEPCTVEDNMFTGIDSCAKGYICQFADDDGKNGTCVEFCDVSAECPNTDSGNGYCVEGANEGVLPICLILCDPLTQDCANEQACYDIAGSFVCYRPDPQPNIPGQDGDNCDYLNACVAGFTCADKAVLDGCMNAGYGCCTPFCALDGTDCTAPEQCNPIYNPAPPGYENVGVCTIPQ